MTDPLTYFGLIAFGATLFALIVGLFSVYNGRCTRRDITGTFKEYFGKADERFEAILNEHKAGCEEHRVMLEALQKAVSS